MMALLLQLVLVRLLGVEEYGRYSLAIAWVVALSVAARLGLDNPLLRIVASAGDPSSDAVAAAHRRAVTAAALAATIATVACAVVLRLAHVANERSSALLIASLGVLPVSVTVLTAEAIRGTGRIGVADSLQLGGWISPLLTIAFLTPMLSIAPSLGGVGAYAAAAWGTMGIAFLSWNRARLEHAGPKRTIARASPPPLFGPARHLYVASLMDLVVSWSGIIILGAVAGDRAVAVYALASRLSMIIAAALRAFIGASAPAFAALHAQGDIAGLRSVARKTTLAITLTSLPLVLPFLVLPHRVLAVFDPGMVAGASVLAILALGQLVNACTGPVSYLLMMTGNEVAQRNVVVFSGILALALHAMLIPTLGPLGAAIGTAVALSAQNLVALGAVNRYVWATAKP